MGKTNKNRQQSHDACKTQLHWALNALFKKKYKLLILENKRLNQGNIELEKNNKKLKEELNKILTSKTDRFNRCHKLFGEQTGLGAKKTKHGNTTKGRHRYR